VECRRRDTIPASDRRALLRRRWPCDVEFPIALFDAAGPLVPGNCGADMVWASALAARQHPLGRLQFAELTGEPLALGIDARERLTDSLLFLGDLASNVDIRDLRDLNRG